jgi:AcrR family transcriptional regulator
MAEPGAAGAAGAAGGLRERKKELTRRQISDTATRMFLEHGFDEVTVADVARAADVSSKTVFNYFARKEDLFFDRSPEAIALITGALEDRAPDETTIGALRRALLGLAATRHPLGRVAARDLPFWRCVERSPALRARLRELGEEAEDGLGALIARTEGAPPGDRWPWVKAAAVVAAFRTLYAHALRRLRDGAPEDEVAAQYAALLARALDAIERGLTAG